MNSYNLSSKLSTLRKELCKKCKICKTDTSRTSNLECINAIYDHVESETNPIYTYYGFNQCYHNYKVAKTPMSVGSLDVIEIWNTDTG